MFLKKGNTMSHVPKIAIIGRPNVGKSALFNCIARKQIAIVEAVEGVTRDRICTTLEHNSRPFILIDTGGLDSSSVQQLYSVIEEQTFKAIEEADFFVLVVDGTCGVTEPDLRVANLLLKSKKPLCLAINKIDSYHQENLLHEFYSLGIQDLFLVSATQKRNVGSLTEHLHQFLEKNFEKSDMAIDSIKPITFSIIGRANVGKSTLLNTLYGENRCAVSDQAGTTRDSIDIELNRGDKTYKIIDTAGIRKKKAEKSTVDKYAAIRTERTIANSDVCILMIDATMGLTSYDKRIATMIYESGVGCIIVMNKWDLIKGKRMEHEIQKINHTASFLEPYPKLIISAKTGRNSEKLFSLVDTIYDQSTCKIPTPKLNRFLIKALQNVHPPMIMGKRLRIYYGVHTKNRPHTFTLFVNHPSLMTPSYQRYLINQIRKEYAFTGIPINLELKGKERATATDKTPSIELTSAKFQNKKLSDKEVDYIEESLLILEEEEPAEEDSQIENEEDFYS